MILSCIKGVKIWTVFFINRSWYSYYVIITIQQYLQHWSLIESLVYYYLSPRQGFSVKITSFNKDSISSVLSCPNLVINSTLINIKTYDHCFVPKQSCQDIHNLTVLLFISEFILYYYATKLLGDYLH
jgi:hypothetical protein